MSALYAWGANSHGQLGLGFVSEQVTIPTRVEDLPDHINEPSIRTAVGGGGHTFLLTAQGRLFGAGWNASGQVGDGTQVRAVPMFQLIRGLEGHHMVAVACGWAHSIALSQSGQVWVWGSNSHGQLGLPKDEVPFTSLPICLDLTNVVSVSAGLRHTAVATRDGRAYTWGHGHRGQLGHIDSEGQLVKQQPTPKVVDHVEGKVMSVSCGQSTTYALTAEGHVLAWGDNKWGQLAHDPRNVAFFTCPLTIPHNYFGGERVAWLRAGWTHCVAGVTSGAVYVWGRADYGQLGPSEGEKDDSSSDTAVNETLHHKRCRYIPSRLSVNKRIRMVVCGSEHNLSMVGNAGEENALLTWGWNEHGNCGDGTTTNIHQPRVISLPGHLQIIGAGSGHSFALVKLF
ncbi:secretion-regulating guanine nucleotide exchange factor-like [Eriocheir sinensis]|uniref:secretion-regulating guanine nucleotide exchange factor-like n=1 Tax=Eriocheir sinensis TaxID=95602 RepID=UPI0021C60A52|nr:secretion-regulating guanine nucleotide exchange factor-like [Eriocheir sinensis]XP_050726266.1 secretion-regulating guanine nucleotide exchange factor-like [Eriocheir sinensis]